MLWSWRLLVVQCPTNLFPIPSWRVMPSCTDYSRLKLEINFWSCIYSKWGMCRSWSCLADFLSSWKESFVTSWGVSCNVVETSWQDAFIRIVKLKAMSFSSVLVTATAKFLEASNQDSNVATWHVWKYYFVHTTLKVSKYASDVTFS